MTNFTVWVFVSWAAIIAAGLLALYLPVHMNPAPRPDAVPAAPQPAPKPGEDGFWKTPKRAFAPVHLDGEDHALVRPYCGEDEIFVFAARLELPDPLHWLDDVTDAGRVLTGAGAR